MIHSIMSTIQKSRDPTKGVYRSIIGDLSFSVCLPKRYSQNIGLEKGDYVLVTQQDSKIVIEKAEQKGD
jgi:hypothetical protein